VALRREADVVLLPNIIKSFGEIDILRARERDFLVPASSSEKELMSATLLGRHRSEQLLQFLFGVGNSNLALYSRHFVVREPHRDSILFQKKIDNVQLGIDGLAGVSLPLHAL
jgi:hypothetical protein